MSRLAVILALLLLQLVLLFALSGAVNRAAYARLGKAAYLFLMWPGVIVHELSHVVGCVLTRTRVREARLFAPRDEGQGRLVLGFVTHDRPRNPFAASVIGGAPFFGGAAALWGLTALVLPEAGFVGPFAPAADAASLGAILDVVASAGRQYASFVARAVIELDWRSWQTYLFLFFAFSIAAHVAPSRADLRNASFGVVACASLLVVASFVGNALAPGLSSAATSLFARIAGATIAFLHFGLVTLMAAAALLVLLEATSAAAARRHRP